MTSGKVLLSVLAGVAVGAAIGILFAPDKGVETRKKIVKKGGDYALDIKHKFAHWREKHMQQFESVKDNKSGSSKAEDIYTA